MTREITPEQADAVYDILIRHAGARDNGDARHNFVFAVTSSQPTDEYRFMGHLGSGGKFRNNGNNNDVPYVDYYPEERTKSRDAVVLATNAFLAELFGVTE